MSNETRHVKRQGMTKEEAEGLSDKHLMEWCQYSDVNAKQIATWTRTSFQKKMERLPTESHGQFLARKREAGEVDQDEFGRVLRSNLIDALLASEDQTQRRLMDKLSADITPETVREQEAKETARAARENQREMDSDISVRPKGYGGAVGEWEGK